MKKLVILMLVFGLAVSANAALVSSTQGYYFRMDITGPTATPNVGDTLTVEIFAGTDPTGAGTMLNTVLNIDQASSIGAVTISNAGDWSVAPNPSTSVAGSGFDVNVNGNPAVVGGIPTGNSIYSVSFVAVEGVVTVDADAGQWDSLTAVAGVDDGWFSAGAIYGLPYAQVTVVPEPMTIALLGLGGLFLRRKK